MQYYKDYLSLHVDNTLLSLINKAYTEALKDTQLHALKPYYGNRPFETTNSNLLLTDYLYLKTKSYALEHLLTCLLLYKSQIISDYDTASLNKTITPLIFTLNKMHYDTSKSADLNLKGANLIKKRNYLKNQILDVKNSFKEFIDFNAMDRSSPYLYYKNIFLYNFNYDFFYKDIVFYFVFSTNDEQSLLPNTFIKYITSLIHLMYTNTKGDIENSNNLIKLSNTILSYLKKENRFSEYKKIEELLRKMDDDLTKIIAMYETMDSSNSSEKYCFHHLINRYYHNHFFNSLNHPFLDIIFKRIDIHELYNTIIEDNSSYFTPSIKWDNISEDKKMIDNYSIKDSAYHLRLLELLTKFDIDFYQITFDDLYELKTNYGEFKSNRYNFLKEEKLIFDTTTNFIYIFLENYENEIFDTIATCVSDIEIRTINEIKESETISFLDNIIRQINNELDYIYTKIPDDLDFKKIDYENNYNDLYKIIRKYPFLLTYIIKQGFIIG